MRIDRDDFKIEKSADFTSLNFDMANPAIIFDILCNRLYETPLRTLVQEYCSNARDSHREANIADIPIKVVLPTRLQTTLKVIDFGVGISPERMETVFIKLGASTKNNDNLQTGGFGLGCKIGFSYTDSFSIKTIYNGIAYEYIAFMNSDGIPHLDLITKFTTIDDNYTSIEIPIRLIDISIIEDYVYTTCTFWDVKPILINSNKHFINFEDISGISEVKCYDVNNNYLYDYRSSLSLVVDGIIYKGIEKKVDNFTNLFNYKYNEAMFIIVNTGDVDLAINRENLQFTDKTNNKLLEIYKSINDKILSLVSTDMPIMDRFDNLNNNKKLLSMLKNFKTEIDGDIISLKSSNITINPSKHFINITSYTAYVNRNSEISLKVNDMAPTIELFNKYTIFNNTTKPVSKRKIKSYMISNTMNKCNIITVDDITDLQQIEYVKRLTSLDISIINKQNPTPRKKKHNLVVNYIDTHGGKMVSESLDRYINTDIIYITHTEYINSNNIPKYNYLINRYNELKDANYFFLKVSNEIHSKIHDIVPTAIHINKFIEHITVEIDKHISTTDILKIIDTRDNYYHDIYHKIKSIYNVYPIELFNTYINMNSPRSTANDIYLKQIYGIYERLNENGYKKVMAGNILRRNKRKCQNVIAKIEKRYSLFKNKNAIKTIDSDILLDYIKMVEHCIETGYVA